MARPGQNRSASGLATSFVPDIFDDLISSTNPQGKITNSDLELAALVLQEATLLEAVPNQT